MNVWIAGGRRVDADESDVGLDERLAAQWAGWAGPWRPETLCDFGQARRTECVT